MGQVYRGENADEHCRKAMGWPPPNDDQPKSCCAFSHAEALENPLPLGRSRSIRNALLRSGCYPAQAVNPVDTGATLCPDHEIIQHTDVLTGVQCGAYLYDPLHILSRRRVISVIKVAAELLDDVVIGLRHLL